MAADLGQGGGRDQASGRASLHAASKVLNHD
jgi:hypothetical protein